MKRIVFFIIFAFSIISCSSNKPHWSENNKTLFNKLTIYHDTVNDDFKSDIANYLLTNHVNISSTLSFDYLVNNIDYACYYGARSKYHNQVAFNTFCEYIIPPQIDNEPPENWRKLVVEGFSDSLFAVEDITDACSILHKKIIERVHSTMELDMGATRSNIPFSELIKKKKMSCIAMSKLGLYIFRAFNLPITTDFTPHWGNGPNNHYWSVLIIDSCNSVPFNVSFWISDFEMEWWAKPSKIYRKTYVQNKNSHANIVGIDSVLPAFLNNPYLIDVTDKYSKTTNINIPILNKSKSTMYYLTVFDVFGWTLVGFGEGDNYTANFSKIPDSIVFLPMSISKQHLEPINYPFVVKNGRKHFFTPDYKHLQSVVLHRKFHISEFRMSRSFKSYKGIFQESNKRDFSDAVEIYYINDTLGAHYNDIFPSNSKAYRYIRYIGPENSNCNVSEISFYKNNNKGIKGEIFGSESANWSSENPITNAFDGNPLSYADNYQPNGGWIGIDFGRKQIVSRISIVPRCDLNGICLGNIYELFYWDNKWVSLGQQTATKHQLTYHNVPDNALLWLRNHTAGKEERIFTYKKGKQIWW